MREIYPSSFLNIRRIIDEAECYQVIRDIRWPDGIRCPHCDSQKLIKHGKDDAQELDLNRDDAHQMTSQLREGVVRRKPKVTLGTDVECDEVYVVAGHKGNPGAVKKKVVKGDETD
jgi:DNA-directed RNA polymerase subunit RPC12/RpoP